jgi:plastocyanin
LTAPPPVTRFIAVLAALAFAASLAQACAQQPSTNAARLAGHVVLPTAAKSHSPSIVVWLAPIGNSPSVPQAPPGHFKLIQKNRTFIPHLLVIPVGSTVSFPNEDPFFHNVFSLFNGKRFDLGLYEAGSSREVRFSREGISYIFCNIHPEMSAVVIALTTPLYDVAGAAGSFSIHGVPPGTYILHVWIEGAPQPDLDHLSRRITLADGQSSSVTIDASSAYHPLGDHLNMYGKPYPPDQRAPY